MNADRLLEHYERIADAPDVIARLRRFILDLAVRGKLVPQEPQDEPASELLKRITKEKARLGKAGQIRSSKPSAPVRDEELPISVPKTWVWLRLHDIGVLSGGMTPSMNCSDFWGGDIVWLSPKDIKADEVSNSELKITAEGLSETGLETYRPGSLFMVARSGILKRIFPVSINRIPAAANQDMKVLVPFLDGQERYLQIVFRGLTDFILREMVKTGTTVQSLKYAEFEQQPFPLPPLAEQHRIVAKVDELMSLCDRLEAARAEREAVRDRLAAASLARLNAPDPDTFKDDARFAVDTLQALTTRPDQIKHLRQSILNLAVRGKLVPQDPNDEPASELLKRIAKEKARLVKAGEIRKQETFDPVSNADVMFPVPKNWEWVPATFPAFVVSDMDKKVQTKDVLGSGNFPVVDQGKVFIRGYCNDSSKAIRVKAPLILFGDHTRETKLIDFDFVVGADGVKLLQPVCLFTNYYFLALQWLPLESRGYGRHFKLLRASYLPLPPFAEQRRIVAKVDALMALCDRLEASLDAVATTRRRLLDALLAEALAPVKARERDAAE